MRRVFLVKTHDQLGDFLVATPLFAALRVHYGAAKIVLVTRPYLAPLAAGQPALDDVWILPQAIAGPAAASVAARIGAFGPDVAIVLNSVSRSRTADLVAALSGARVVVGRSAVGAGPVVLEGNAPERDPVYDIDVPVAAASVHQVDRLLDFARAVSAQAAIAETAPARMALEASPSALARGASLLSGAPPRIGLHPTAANALKCWPTASFVELASRLAATTGGRPIVCDTPREPGPANEVAQGLEARGVRVRFMPADTLKNFMGTVAALDLMIANDSGVVHIAAALGVPVLSFHSLGRPEEWAPRNTPAIALHAEPIAGISVDAAYEAAVALLAMPRKG